MFQDLHHSKINIDNFDEIVEHYRYPVASKVRAMADAAGVVDNGIVEEWHQAALTGLFEAVRTFDANKLNGTTFRTYALYKVGHAVADYCAEFSDYSEHFTKVDAQVRRALDDGHLIRARSKPARGFDDRDRVMNGYNFVLDLNGLASKYLDSKSIQMLHRYYVCGETFQEIGKHFGMHHANVIRAIEKAVAKLRRHYDVSDVDVAYDRESQVIDHGVGA